MHITLLSVNRDILQWRYPRVIWFKMSPRHKYRNLNFTYFMNFWFNFTIANFYESKMGNSVIFFSQLSPSWAGCCVDLRTAQLSNIAVNIDATFREVDVLILLSRGFALSPTMTFSSHTIFFLRQTPLFAKLAGVVHDAKVLRYRISVH